MNQKTIQIVSSTCESSIELLILTLSNMVVISFLLAYRIRPIKRTVLNKRTPPPIFSRLEGKWPVQMSRKTPQKK